MEQDKTVAIFVPSLRGGGAEQVMVTLANGFAARGIKVDLVLVSAEGPYLNGVVDAVRVFDLGASRVLLSLLALIRYLRLERPAVLLSALNHTNIVAILACRFARTKIRLLVSEHNNLTSSVNNQTLRRERLLPRLMRWLYPFADVVIAVSMGVADDLAKTIKLPREQIRVIYNPIFSEDLLKKTEERVVEPWFMPASPPVILAVGRLTEQKDFPMLIKAFSKLRNRRDVRLLIIGEGPDRIVLESLINELGLKDSVEMPGFKNNPITYMKRVDVFVLSSRWEGFGNVLVEAMACGTPVISTDCPSGPAEILENGKWGCLVPVGDVNALAQAIAVTLDEAVHPDVAKRARDFSADIAIDLYMSIFGFPES